MKKIIFILIIFLAFLIVGCSRITSEQDQITKKAIQCYYNVRLDNGCSFEKASLVDFKSDEDNYLVYVDIPNYKCESKPVEERRCMRFEIKDREKCPKQYVVDFCKNQTKILAQYSVINTTQK